MGRLGLTHDEADDFEHPALPVGHPMRHHVLYRLRREDWGGPGAATGLSPRAGRPAPAPRRGRGCRGRPAPGARTRSPSGSAPSNPWSAVSRMRDLVRDAEPAPGGPGSVESRASARRSESRAMSERGPPPWWPASVTTLAHQVRAGAVAGSAHSCEHLLQPDVVDLRRPRVVAVLEVRPGRAGSGDAVGVRQQVVQAGRAAAAARWRGSAPSWSSRRRGRSASSTLAVRGAAPCGSVVVDHLEDRAHRRAAATPRCGARSIASLGTTRSPVARS